MKLLYQFLGIIICLLLAYSNSIGWAYWDSVTSGRIGHRSFRMYHK